MQRGEGNRKISYSFLYLIHKIDKNNYRVWQAKVQFFFQIVPFQSPDFPHLDPWIQKNK